MSAECQRQRATDEHQQLEHVSILAGAGARINSDEFWRGSAVGKGSMPPKSRWLLALPDAIAQLEALDRAPRTCTSVHPSDAGRLVG